MKQAFLIIAHDNFSLLQRLIYALECSEVDIYVHIDAKVKDIPVLHLPQQGSLLVLQDRIDTRWGDFSQIETELRLLDAASKNGPYSHYHLISGVHFPLKPLGEILNYYNCHSGKVITTGLCQSTELQERIKLRHYNLFTKRFAYGSSKRKKVNQILWRASHKVQDVLNIRRNNDVTFYKASNWISLTEDTTKYILSKREYIKTIFKWSFCGDEYFVPTLLMDSPFAKDLFDSDSILMQNMGSANTRTFGIEDYPLLSSSDCLFARKFSEKHIDVVELLSKN